VSVDARAGAGAGAYWSQNSSTPLAHVRETIRKVEVRAREAL
jgi:hypothetical protein